MSDSTTTGTSINSVKGILPTVDYPQTIRGSLRLILQLKDAFLGCFNLVEEYRDLLLSCKHGFTRDLVVYQLTKGLVAIKRLREDLNYVESQARNREKRNKLLRQYLVDRYDTPDAKDRNGAPLGIVTRVGPQGQVEMGGGTAIIGAAIPPPLAAPDSIDQALHGGLNHYTGDVNVDELQVPEEINLATTLTESGAFLMPVVEFYRAFYFLQMHFQLIMCQAANYALPVVTRPMSVSERTFSWPTMPSYGLASKSGGMRDRLLEINSDVLALAARLHECLALVRQKMQQDKKIEAYFTRHTAAQENLRRALLRGLQAQRVYMEALEAQNDRLAGLAIKLDPTFARSTDFAIMTGPGLNIPDDDFATNQNSAIPGAPIALTKPNRNEPRDRDPRNGPGGFGSHAPANRDNYQPSEKENRRNNDSRSGNRQPSGSHRPDKFDKHHEPDGFYPNDTNISATGGGRPAVWVQQATSAYTNSEHDGEMDSDLTRKITQLRGHSQAVEELLIGVDSVATGMGRFATDMDHMATPSYMNTDQYVTSLYDEVFGQIPNTKSLKKSATSTSKNAVRVDQHSSRTSSTKFTQAEAFSSTLSTKQSINVVSEPSTQRAGIDQEIRNELRDRANKRVRDDAVRVHQEGIMYPAESDLRKPLSPESQGESDSVENTSSEELNSTQHLDTNVNASHGRLPKLPTTSRHPLSKITRTAKSSPPIRRIRTGPDHAEIPGCPPPPDKATGDKYDQGILHTANEVHLRQVPMVGAAECGHMCAPDWLSSRAQMKVIKSEDLLDEPKRSAFNKAVVAHRCRLVETILQADEDRLEEIINLLLKH